MWVRILIFSLLAFSLAENYPAAADEHGGEEVNWNDEGTDLSSDVQIQINGVPVAGTGSDSGDPQAVPSQVRNWFEEYALQKELEARQAGERPLLTIEQTNTTRSNGGNAIATTPTLPRLMGKEGGAVAAPVAPSATATINQFVTPAITVNNFLGEKTAKALEEEKATEAAADSVRATGRAQNLQWLSGDLAGSPERLAVKVPWNQKVKRVISLWFNGESDSAKVSVSEEAVRTSSRAQRQLSQVGDGGGDYFSSMPVREVEDLTSSRSWFGWVGWIVAFALLLWLVFKAQQEFFKSRRAD